MEYLLHRLGSAHVKKHWPTQNFGRDKSMNIL